MQRTLIRELGSRIGQTATIAGFVQTIRNQGKIKFLLVRDISGFIQVVVLSDKTDLAQTVAALSLESVIAVSGVVKAEKQAPGGLEIAADQISVLSRAEPELPIPVVEKNQAETDQAVRLDWRWLDLRQPKHALVFQVWTTMEAAFRQFWVARDYIEIHSPKIIATPSESGAEVFELKYFDRKAYLAQSPQFYKQMAMAAGFEKVFEIGPVFRAEPSFTSRHATEFTGYDLEMAYIDSHEEVMAEEEQAIQFVLQKVKEKHGEAIKTYFHRELTVPTLPFPRVALTSFKPDGDLSPEDERALSQKVLAEQNHEFVFVTGYPIGVRPFYHMRESDNPKLTKSFDLLWNGLEVTTGAQREHRYDVLIAQAKEKGMNIEAIQFYLNFFRYGCPPHGGFGMGPNRMLMKLLGLENVREASFLYRGVKRLEP